MKRFSVLLSGLVVLSLALVCTTAQARNRFISFHKASYEVVSVDVDASTITLRDEKGDSTTSPVLPDAVDKLALLSAGMKVIVTCRDNDDGDHEGIVAIEVVKPRESSQEAKSYHQNNYEVVAVDIEGKRITLKDEDGEQFTSPVMGKALEKLEDLMAGMQIMATCQDNNAGEHEGIVDIEIMNLTAW